MTKEKYTIILDTNILGGYKGGGLNVSDFNYFHTDKNVFESLIRFIKNNPLLDDIEIAISKISIEEIKHQQNKIFEEKKNKLLELINELSSISESNTDLEDLDYQMHLSTKAGAFAGVWGLKVLDYPSDSCLPRLIEKVLARKKPFYKKNLDSGFKDALIWESIIQYAKEEPDRKYIFLTKDPDFSQNLVEEFKSETKSNITIKSSVLDVKKFLDEKANLKIQFNKMSQVYSNNFKIIENETNRKFKRNLMSEAEFSIDRISLSKELFDLEKVVDNEEYFLTVEGNIFYSKMIWDYNPIEDDVDWHLKRGVEPDLFHIHLKKVGNSYKIISIKNTVSNLIGNSW